jgi:hypothetical protein
MTKGKPIELVNLSWLVEINNDIKKSLGVTYSELEETMRRDNGEAEMNSVLVCFNAFCVVVLLLIITHSRHALYYILLPTPHAHQPPLLLSLDLLLIITIAYSSSSQCIYYGVTYYPFSRFVAPPIYVTFPFLSTHLGLNTL